MDLNAYHRAWMNGATEAEAVRAGDDAYFENMAYAAQQKAAYEHEQRLIVGDAVKLGDRRLIEDIFKGEVVALHKNGSIRVRLDDGREIDGWPERTKPIPNKES